MNDKTRHDIDEIAWKTLRDAGLGEPPVTIVSVLDHLNLHRDFYDLKDPSFLDKIKYTVRVCGKSIAGIIKKIDLRAVLFYDEDRIVIDSELPILRQDWPSFHETGHKILGWHKPYYYGDTAQTLNPDFHEILEAEANYAASALMFCGPIFTEESYGTKKEWASIKELQKRYGRTITTTLRRYVEHGPDHPMAMLVGAPYWKVTPDQKERCRHFVKSEKFEKQFGDLKLESILDEVDKNCAHRRGGPVADFKCSLDDNNGDAHEFHVEAFYNRHDLLTFCVQIKKSTTKRIILPRAINF